VVAPRVGVDLPPFYTMPVVQRLRGPALLFNGIDGKVQLVEDGALQSVSAADCLGR
jgi:hypothetical protein